MTRPVRVDATGASRCVLLLHGLGATGATWRSVEALLEARGDCRTIAPDLRGHGAAAWRPSYSVEEAAADLAAVVAAERDLYVVGHSFGGYVALALAGSRFGVGVRGVLVVGTKLSFSADERSRAAELARRPARLFASRAEAVARYRKVSGLDERLAPGDALIARGIAADGVGFRLAADPATVGVEVPPFATLLAGTRGPVVVARGEHDALVSSAELRAAAADAIDVPGVGHNLHVEAPAALVALLDRLIAAAAGARQRPT